MLEKDKKKKKNERKPSTPIGPTTLTMRNKDQKMRRTLWPFSNSTKSNRDFCHYNRKSAWAMACIVWQVGTEDVRERERDRIRLQPSVKSGQL